MSELSFRASEKVPGYEFYKGMNYQVQTEGGAKNIALQAWQMKALIAKGANTDLLKWDDDQKPEDVIDSVLDSIPEQEEVEIDLTSESAVVDYMEASTSAMEWDIRADEVRHANNSQYPAFWGPSIVSSGMIQRKNVEWKD